MQDNVLTVGMTQEDGGGGEKKAQFQDNGFSPVHVCSVLTVQTA